MSNKAYLVSDFDWLKLNYEKKQRTVKEIAEQAHCHLSTVYGWLHHYNISVRGPTPDKLFDKDWLYYEYIEQKRTQQQIANELGCSRKTIQAWLNKHDIPVRTQSEAGLIRIPCSDETRQRLSEAGKRHQPRTAAQCLAISVRMKRHWQDPDRRTYHLAAMKEKVWPSRGEGTYPPGFNKKFKDEIRDRDEWRCAVCLLPGDNAHHIDYDKDNTTDKNCITLCRKCHSTTNFHREYWQDVLQNMMTVRLRHVAERDLFGV